jgi:hypothetical protein
MGNLLDCAFYNKHNCRKQCDSSSWTLKSELHKITSKYSLDHTDHFRAFAVGKISNKKKGDFGTYASFALKRFLKKVSKTGDITHELDDKKLSTMYDEFEQIMGWPKYLRFGV